MSFTLLFVSNSILLGVGLAMDAFSVSLANGLYEPRMPFARAGLIAGTFGLFQAVMPLTGWFLVHSVAEIFKSVQPFIPAAALVLLLFIGIKMISEGVRGEEEKKGPLRGSALFIQGVATSIDALSVGFTIAEYDLIFALCESLIIGAVTLIICVAGLYLGKRVGTGLSDKAVIAGGVILILIGAEIFVTGVLHI